MINHLQAIGGSFGNLEALKGRKDPEAVRAAAQEMEALFAYELIKAMRQTVKTEDDGLGADTYATFFDLEIARLFAEQGLGLKEILLKGLERNAGRTQESRVNGKELSTPVGNPPATPFVQRSKAHTSEAQIVPGITDMPTPGSWSHPSRTSSMDPDPSNIDPQMPVEGVVSSAFGMRRHPLRGDRRFHHGIDIAAPEGSPIYPLRGGKVVFSGERAGYGNTVVIDHGDGMTSTYAHNRRNFVAAGDTVDGYGPIAEVGSTGLSTGPHLHFEIAMEGKKVNPLDVVAQR